MLTAPTSPSKNFEFEEKTCFFGFCFTFKTRPTRTPKAVLSTNRSHQSLQEVTSGRQIAPNQPYECSLRRETSPIKGAHEVKTPSLNLAPLDKFGPTGSLRNPYLGPPVESLESVGTISFLSILVTGNLPHPTRNGKRAPSWGTWLVV